MRDRTGGPVRRSDERSACPGGKGTQVQDGLADDMIARFGPLLGLWPWEIEDARVLDRRVWLARLSRRLRAERRRGLAGHWSYDLGRHRQLLQIYRELKKASLSNLKN